MKKIFREIFIIMASLSIIYFFAAMAYRITFAKFFAVLGIVLFVIGLNINFICNKYLAYKNTLVFRIIAAILACFIATFVIIESLIIYSGIKKDDGKVDYLVILGAGLWGDTPSLILT